MTSFDDIETELVALLKASVSVPVATQVPADRPTAFIRVWVTGGNAEQRILDRPTVTVQAWAGDSVTASALATTCRDAFLKRFGARAELTRPYFDPDPGTGIPRYTFSFRVRNRAHE